MKQVSLIWTVFGMYNIDVSTEKCVISNKLSSTGSARPRRTSSLKAQLWLLYVEVVSLCGQFPAEIGDLENRACSRALVVCFERTRPASDGFLRCIVSRGTVRALFRGVFRQCRCDAMRCDVFLILILKV
ncbi:hypothetical protein SeMB42_g00457 [Synchytrium endobioticum]|uniref:Uncharacterized protein n=1 Tax=Synchytrium endobioticum TaxID=286115 RepID=A0A507DT10_9FUNG|nr:hypothetical protein SeMB42_g00457 [Synchytrium endobioticum]